MSNLNQKQNDMNSGLPIYMDNNATTPVDPRVLEKMIPYFTMNFGNAASRNHAFGWNADKAVETARQQIASLIGANEKEIIFTSGATESNNMAVLGVAEMYKDRGNHIVSVVTEHKAIIDPIKHLEESGAARVTWLGVDRNGQIDLSELKNALTDQTVLVSIMHGNNEIGTLQKIAEIGAICRERGVLFHTDAVQTVGKIPVNVDQMNIDLLSLSGHKIYGPKGIGALYVRRRNPRVRLAPILFGGGHERGMRSGTLNVPGIVGLGEACAIAQREMADEAQRTRELRDRLHKGLQAELDELYLNGHPTERLPGNLNISFAFCEGESLMMGIKEIAVSSGSACTSASLEPSYVLRALGVREDLAHTSIRFGLGRFTTTQDVDQTIQKVVLAVKKLREMSPLYEMVKEGIDLNTVQWTGH
jgi:cysteine desulfurase